MARERRFRATTLPAYATAEEIDALKAIALQRHERLAQLVRNAVMHMYGRDIETVMRRMEAEDDHVPQSHS